MGHIQLSTCMLLNLRFRSASALDAILRLQINQTSFGVSVHPPSPQQFPFVPTQLQCSVALTEVFVKSKFAVTIFIYNSNAHCQIPSPLIWIKYEPLFFFLSLTEPENVMELRPC